MKKNLSPFLISLCLSATLGVAPAQAEDSSEAKTFGEALTGGTTKISLRYRFETVDDDAFEDTAEASTLRTTLSYFTGEWKGWSAFVEAENVAGVFDDDGYNNAGAGALNNGVRGVPVVADPEITEINQAFLRYNNDRLKVTLGRQAINLGDQRFVGAVAWRQHHQTFDAARFEVQASPQLKLDYTYTTRVHRIVGNRVDFDSHLLYVPIKLGDAHTLTAYGFYLDFDTAVTASTSTYGLEYQGKFSLSDRVGLNLELEAAQQDDAGDNPLLVDTQYLLATVGASFGSIVVDASWELLGERGDGRRSFQTPLATLHKFNGWADKFLVTPNAGLETLSLRVRGTINPNWNFLLAYMDFTSDGGDFDFGSEIDAQVVYKSPWKQTFALKLASYDADRFSSDTDKLMLWSSYTF